MNAFAVRVLNERQIGKFAKDVRLKIEVATATTKHAEERQSQRNISDSDILTTAYKATDKIFQDLIDGRIRDGEPFHIYDPANNHLNLIAIVRLNEKGTPEKLRIITAIRKRDFKQNQAKRTVKV